MHVLPDLKKLERKYPNELVAVDAFPVRVPLEMAEGQARLHIALSIYYCKTKNEGLCFFTDALIEVPVTASPEAGAGRVAVDYSVPH